MVILSTTYNNKETGPTPQRVKEDDAVKDFDTLLLMCPMPYHSAKQ